jgi:hypothetical protein
MAQRVESQISCGKEDSDCVQATFRGFDCYEIVACGFLSSHCTLIYSLA